MKTTIVPLPLCFVLAALLASAACADSKSTRPTKHVADAGYEALCGLNVMRNDAGQYAVDDYLGRIVPAKASNSRWLNVMKKGEVITFDIDDRAMSYTVDEVSVGGVTYASFTLAGSAHPDLLVAVTRLDP